jgi:cell division protein FtsW
MAHSLSKKESTKIKDFSIGVLPHLIFILPMCLLIILQPDFGTAMMLVSLLIVMLFVAGVPARFMLAMGSVSSVAAALLISCKGYRLARLMTFVDPWKNASDSGFQIVQSFLAFGAGGICGTGLGKGTQKLFYLPEPHTDFILSVIGEELGFIGVIFVILLFLTFIICGIKIAIHASDLFGTYLAVGIIFLTGLQTVTNMGVVMGLLPTKGIPLPFVSYGGTSLLINLTGVGILLSISAQGNYRTKG